MLIFGILIICTVLIFFKKDIILEQLDDFMSEVINYIRTDMIPFFKSIVEFILGCFKVSVHELALYTLTTALSMLTLPYFFTVNDINKEPWYLQIFVMCWFMNIVFYVCVCGIVSLGKMESNKRNIW